MVSVAIHAAPFTLADALTPPSQFLTNGGVSRFSLHMCQMQWSNYRDPINFHRCSVRSRPECDRVRAARVSTRDLPHKLMLLYEICSCSERPSCGLERKARRHPFCQYA